MKTPIRIFQEEIMESSFHRSRATLEEESRLAIRQGQLKEALSADLSQYEELDKRIFRRLGSGITPLFP
jgi:hypothetical protein